jgi:hypothetical protein
MREIQLSIFSIDVKVGNSKSRHKSTFRIMLYRPEMYIA